ncbi:MAG: AAA family ATPase, partial [Bacteroidales bacterium]|nr:AAA family ATPase [Bacteroidales bacterium]
MRILYQKFETLLQNTTTDFKRYLYKNVSWDSRMVGIIGARGVGKTTMILQHIKEKLDSKKALYVSADDMYFSENRLFDLADDFYKNAGEYLFIDEIHKYTDWSRELKNIYDSFPTLKVVFTGSSVLDILKGSADLSRRAIIYKLQGLSFREYLKFFHNYETEVYSLEQIINNEVKLENIQHPLPLFNDYLKRGYYPFGIENEMNLRLGQIIVQTLESDIPQYANLNVGTSRKLKRLLSIIAESVPFKPNFSKISEMISVSRNSLDDYFSYMEKAGLIGQLRNEISGIRGLGKVDKVYLDNTNIIFNLVGDKSNVGNLRETFFFNQMRVEN